MANEMELLLLNTAVVDIRHRDFAFASKLAGPGGLAKCPLGDMPTFADSQYRDWISSGCVTAGGPGNTAPLAAHAGLRVAVGCYVGSGSEPDGLDVPGRYFTDVLAHNGVDVSAIRPYASLPTGLTFIHDVAGDDRGGLAYFPNANHEFDFDDFKQDVLRLNPLMVYYMYSGLSDRGDANEGRDLAAFMRWCREQGSLTIADSHTLCANPEELIQAGKGVAEYRLLDPLLPELDLFFTSWDEARMIAATLGAPLPEDRDEALPVFLDWMVDRYATDSRPRLFGVTLKDGAYVAGVGAEGRIRPMRVVSRFKAGGVVDLVGAGDSFRSGVVSYVCRHAEAFRAGNLNFEEAVQMGNLMAILYITAPLSDRYGSIPAYEQALEVIRSSQKYETVEALRDALSCI